MKPELNDCVCEAVSDRSSVIGPSSTRRCGAISSWALRAANKFIEEPACSNSAQKTTETTIRISASKSRWPSSRVHFAPIIPADIPQKRRSSGDQQEEHGINAANAGKRQAQLMGLYQPVDNAHAQNAQKVDHRFSVQRPQHARFQGCRIWRIADISQQIPARQEEGQPVRARTR